MGKLHPSVRFSRRARSRRRRSGAARRGLADRIANALFAHYAEILEPDPETVDEIRAGFNVSARAVAQMFESPGSIYVFGDERHGAQLFDMLDVILPTLSPAHKRLLHKSRFFTESARSYVDFKKHMPAATDFIPLDDLLGLNPVAATRAEMFAKRLHTVNNRWIPYIDDNLTARGLNIIALGRSHLYNARGLPEEAPWPSVGDQRTPVQPFQVALASALAAAAAATHETPIKTFIFVSPDDPDKRFDARDEDLVKPVTPTLPRIFF